MILERKRLGTIVVAFGIALLMGILLAVPAWAQDATEAQYAPGPDDQCPGAEIVAEVGPTKDNATASFKATGDTLRVTYQVQFDDNEPFNSLDIDIEDRFGLVEGESFDESGTASFIVVTEEPESFDLITELQPANSGKYTVVVEDCVGDQQNPISDNNDDNNADDDNADDDNAEDPEVVNTPDKDLPNTGGVPLLGIVFFVLAGAGLLTSVVRRRD